MSILRNLRKYSAINTKKSGFTIVELLVVIIVIGILAAITAVAYIGISKKADASSMRSDLANASTQLKLDQVTAGVYPATLALANNGDGIKSSNGATYQYSVNNTAPAAYCLTITKNNQSYNVTNDSATLPGVCPIAWWPLNGNANDASGNGHVGTVYNATTTVGANGDIGGALYFSGVSPSYINIPSFNHNVIQAASMNASWSLSIWTKFGGVYGIENILIGRNGCNGGIYTYDNKYAFAIKGSGCWTGAQTIYGQVLDSNWHMLTATYAAGFMSFYQDGVLQGTATLLDMYSYSDLFGLASGGNSSFNFNGSLDDARVYDVALSASDVSNLYSASAR